MFINEVKRDVQNNSEFNDTAFAKKLTDFEDKRSRAHDHFQSRPSGDCMHISRMLIKKYAQEIEVSGYKLKQ